jgi:hypothetical protein
MKPSIAAKVVAQTMIQEMKIPITFAKKAFLRFIPKRYPAIVPE